jgi:hypothetical protein
MENPEHNQGTGSPVEPSVTASKGQRKQVRVDPETFMADLRRIVATEKDPLVKLRPMIKVGFVGEVNSNHVSQVVEILGSHTGAVERLALSLAVQERFGKSRLLARRVLSEIRASFESAIQFDQLEFRGYRAPHAIERWIGDHSPKGSQSERDIWFRRFAVCLLNEVEPKTLLVGLVAASRVWMSSKPQKALSEEAQFVRGIAAALGGPTIGSNRLDLILAGVAAIDVQFRQMLNREFSLERQIRANEESIDGLRRNVSSLEAEVARSRTDSEEKAARIEELQQSLAEAAERYELLDRHWRGVSEQQLAKQSGSFRGKISHEVEEAILSLDREDPNTDMALDRVRRIREILER